MGGSRRNGEALTCVNEQGLVGLQSIGPRLPLMLGLPNPRRETRRPWGSRLRALGAHFYSQPHLPRWRVHRVILTRVLTSRTRCPTRCCRGSGVRLGPARFHPRHRIRARKDPRRADASWHDEFFGCRGQHFDASGEFIT